MGSFSTCRDNKKCPQAALKSPRTFFVRLARGKEGDTVNGGSCDDLRSYGRLGWDEKRQNDNEWGRILRYACLYTFVACKAEKSSIHYALRGECAWLNVAFLWGMR